MTRLAILGGTPAFPAGLAFVRPPRPPIERVMRRLRPSYEEGMLTNGPLVRELEVRIAARLEVPHALAVSSCTAGLMLAIQAYARPGDLVLMPSFTFAATAHAAAWTGARPVFAECGADDFLLDLDDARARLDRSVAIVATHVFGAPCHPRAVESLAAEHGVAVVFDAAHALGSVASGRPVGGFGDAEVFSLSPTKPVIAGEGGLVTTRDPDLADRIRIGRDYANPGNYDTAFVGLNARMSEFHAAMALESLDDLDDHLGCRQVMADRYRCLLAGVAGVEPQHVAPEDTSTYKDFTVRIDETAFGVGRDALVEALLAEGIVTRSYFSPPVHRQQAYRNGAVAELPTTDLVASQVVSLPLWRDLGADAIEVVADVIARVHDQAAMVRDHGRLACAPS